MVEIVIRPLTGSRSADAESDSGGAPGARHGCDYSRTGRLHPAQPLACPEPLADSGAELLQGLPKGQSLRRHLHLARQDVSCRPRLRLRRLIGRRKAHEKRYSTSAKESTAKA